MSGLFHLFLFLFLTLMLVTPGLASEGARSGLLLWYQTVLPTLFPFMICVSLFSLPTGIRAKKPRQSAVGLMILLTGLLCGYPMGAKLVHEQAAKGTLSKKQSLILSSCCNYPSPMFFLGIMVPAIQRKFPVSVSALSVALYLPGLFLFFLAKRYYRDQTDRITALETGHNQAMVPRSFSVVLEQVLADSAGTMIRIAEYLMLFSVLNAYLRHGFRSLPVPCACLSCLLEMTSGIQLAADLTEGRTAAMLILGAGAFGGLSVCFQIKSVTKNVGLSIRHFLLWKGLHCLFSIILLGLLTV